MHKKELPGLVGLPGGRPVVLEHRKLVSVHVNGIVSGAAQVHQLPKLGLW